jgi:hypothetical protein
MLLTVLPSPRAVVAAPVTGQGTLKVAKGGVPTFDAENALRLCS